MSITDSPTVVMERLSAVEVALAELGPKLAYAAHQRVVYTEYIKRAKAGFLATVDGKNKEEKDAAVVRLLEQHGPLDGATVTLLDGANQAEAAYASHKLEFEVLDTRRSILQSALKYHLAEADPSGGPEHHGR